CNATTVASIGAPGRDNPAANPTASSGASANVNWPRSTLPAAVAVNTPASSTATVPARCRSRDEAISRCGNGNPSSAVPDPASVTDFQSSLCVPAPAARFSFNSPPETDTLTGSRASDRLIPVASTPSQLFAPCARLIKFTETDADTPPPPPEPCNATTVASIGAPVRDNPAANPTASSGASANVNWPRSTLPAAVALNTPPTPTPTAAGRPDLRPSTLAGRPDAAS